MRVRVRARACVCVCVCGVVQDPQRGLCSSSVIASFSASPSSLLGRATHLGDLPEGKFPWSLHFSAFQCNLFLKSDFE